MRNAYQLSLDQQVLHADPVELVILLYRAALESVRQAREHLASGEIQERGRQISRASAILTELTVSLNHEVGGAFSQNLAELYDYLQRLLATAHQQQREEPLRQAEPLLQTLLDAWVAAHTVKSVSTAASPYGPPEFTTPDQPLSYQV